MEYRSPEREREHRAKLDEIGSTIDLHVQQIMSTRILCTVGHIYTVNKKGDNIQFTRASIQLREQFICENLSSYAHMPTCTPRRLVCSAYHRRHIGISL